LCRKDRLGRPARSCDPLSFIVPRGQWPPSTEQKISSERFICSRYQNGIR
jgi:hypothetical protein